MIEEQLQPEGQESIQKPEPPYRKKVYDLLSSKFSDFKRTEEDFYKKLDTEPEYYSKVHDLLSNKFNDFKRPKEEFKSMLGLKKKDAGASPIPLQSPSPSVGIPAAPSQPVSGLDQQIAATRQNLSQPKPEPKPTTPAPTFDDIRKGLREGGIRPTQDNLTVPKQVQVAAQKGQAQIDADKAAPKQMMVFNQPRFKYSEEQEKTAKIAGFQSAQQMYEFDEEGKAKKQEKLQEAADNFYNTFGGKLFYNIVQPLGTSASRNIGNISATALRIAGLGEIADGVSDTFNPEKRYAGTVAGTTPTKLQGGLFNDGRMNWSKIVPSVVNTLSDAAWLLGGASTGAPALKAAGATERVATGASLFGASYLQQRENYYQEGKAAGLRGDQADYFATGAAALTSILEPIFPNTLALGGFRNQLAKNYAGQIARGITSRVAMKEAVKAVAKETLVKEPAQEMLQLAGDKAAMAISDFSTGQGNFKDRLEFNNVKDEVYETLVLTPITSLLMSGSGAFRRYSPTNYEKSVFYEAAKTPEKVNQILDNQFINKEITEEQYKQAKTRFNNYDNSIKQAQQLGYSDDQTIKMAWELFSAKEKLPVNNQISADPVLREALGQEVKKDSENVSNSIRSIGMGVPSVGEEISGGDVSVVISNIGDKGVEISQQLVDQIGEDNYRVEEVSVRDLYNSEPEFKEYVDSYKKGSISDDAKLVPAVMKDNAIIDGRARLAEQFIAGKDNVKIFKNVTDAINESQVQEGRTEGDIIQPAGVVQGQQEAGQGTGIQGQAQIPQADAGDSNINRQGEIVAPELSNIEIQPTVIVENAAPFVNDVKVAAPEVETGSTMNIDGTQYTGGGLVVPAASMNTTVEEITPEMVAQFVEQNRGKISGENFKVGIYKFPNSNRASIDLNIVVPAANRAAALEFGRAAGQESLFDLDTFENVKTGADGANPMSFSDEQFREIANALANNRVPNVFGQQQAQQQGTQDVDAITRELLDELGLSTIDTMIENASQSLADTGVTIDVINDPVEYDNMVESMGGQRGTDGVFVAQDGKILLNNARLKSGINAGRVIWHEASHPVMNIIRNTNRDLYDRAVRGAKEAAPEAFNWASENYDSQASIDDETLVEATSMVADGTIDLAKLPTGFRQTLIDFVNNVAKLLGFDPVLNDTDLGAFRKLAAEVSEALKSGRSIEGIVGAENVTRIENNIDEALSPEVVDAGEYSIQPRVTGKPAIDIYAPQEVEQLPVRSIADIHSQYDGKAVVINSDPTRVGELILTSGKTIFMYGGPDYLSIRQNVEGNVGFATTQLSKVRTWQNYVNQLFGGAPGVTLVGVQAPTSLLSNSYALRAVMDAISTLPKRVLRSSQFKNEFFGKDLVLLKDAFGDDGYNEFVKKYRSADLTNPEVVDGMIAEMAYKVGDDNRPASFKARGAFVSNLLAGVTPKANIKGVEGDVGYVSQSPKKFIAKQLFDRHGLNAEKMFYDLGHKPIVDLYMNEGRWGMAVSGFETDPNLQIDQVQDSGVVHPLFNAKFPGKNPFILDGAYDLNQMFTPVEMTAQSGRPYTKTAPQMLSGSMYVKGAQQQTESTFEFKPAEPAARKIQARTNKAPKKGVNLIEEAGYDLGLTEDNKGNYLFFHFSNKDLTKSGIDPSKHGASRQTSRQEAMQKPNVSYYYTTPSKESFTGDFGHVVAIPKHKVYPFQKDPLNLYDEAREAFLKDYPFGGFGPNQQIGWISKIAAKYGFEMVVGKWNNGLYRGETTIKHKPEFYSKPGPGVNNTVYNPKYENVKPNRKKRRGGQSRVSEDVQESKGVRPTASQEFKLGAFVLRKRQEGVSDDVIRTAIKNATGKTDQEIDTILANPELYIRDSAQGMTPDAARGLAERAKVTNIYKGATGKINPAFTGLEVPESIVNERLNRDSIKTNTVGKLIDDVVRKGFDPAKGLPSWVLAIKDKATGSKNIEIARAVKTMERLKTDADKIGFTDWNTFGEAMKSITEGVDTDAMNNLPDEMKDYVVAMRTQIDKLTKDLISSGYVTPEQAKALEGNIGQYVNRAYRIFNEKGYTPPKEAITEAVKFIADQKFRMTLTDLVDNKGRNIDQLNVEDLYRQATEDAIKDVNSILDKKRNPFFNTSSETRDTGILKERKDIPEPIRKLMGEYTDPGTVFVMTVAKQAALKAQSQYLTKLRQFGMGTIFFEKNDPNRPAEFSVEIASEGTETKSPLGGLYTTPEIAEAIESVNPTYNELTNAWMKVVGAVRWGKTVGSVATQFLNFESNLGFAVMNGLLFTGKSGQAFKGAAKYVKGQYSKSEIDAITEKAISLGLVDQGVGAREISTMLGSGDIHDIALDLSVNPESKLRKAKKIPSKIFGAFNKAYRMGDDFWKVYGYLNEREVVSRARFGTNYDKLTAQEQEQVDNESSERVKSTWPTYDRVLPAAKYISQRAPIFGNFVSFVAESIRVLTNSAKIAAQDLKDPQMREAGMKRAAGIATYLSLRAALTYAAAYSSGMAASGILGMLLGDEEEEQKKRAIKKAMPLYARTADILVLPTDQPHKFTVYSLSRLDPYNVVFNSMNALTEGREGVFSKEMEPGVAAAVTEFFSGFMEPEMTFQTLWSVINNNDPRTGKKIVSSTDDAGEAFANTVGFIWKTLEPSTVALIERGAERGFGPEAASLVGARPIDVDLHKSFGFILSDAGRDMDEVNREFNSINFSDKYTEEEKKEAEAKKEEKLNIIANKTHQVYKDFIALGADPELLKKMINERRPVKSTGFTGEMKGKIKRGAQ